MAEGAVNPYDILVQDGVAAVTVAKAMPPIYVKRGSSMFISRRKACCIDSSTAGPSVVGHRSKRTEIRNDLNILTATHRDIQCSSGAGVVIGEGECEGVGRPCGHSTHNLMGLNMEWRRKIEAIEGVASTKASKYYVLLVHT